MKAHAFLRTSRRQSRLFVEASQVMKPQNRIVFHGNPWPNGHRIRSFDWEAEQRGSDVWFQFHLETEDYNKDAPGQEPANEDDDWKAPIVWNNYHRCKMSTSEWHAGGFRACARIDFTAARLDGLQLHVDAAETDLPGTDTDARFTCISAKRPPEGKNYSAMMPSPTTSLCCPASATPTASTSRGAARSRNSTAVRQR
jgi:hypothetical protein